MTHGLFALIALTLSAALLICSCLVDPFTGQQYAVHPTNHDTEWTGAWVVEQHANNLQTYLSWQDEGTGMSVQIRQVWTPFARDAWRFSDRDDATRAAQLYGGNAVPLKGFPELGGQD